MKRKLGIHEHKRPKEIQDSDKQDHEPNNSCRASPNIPEIYISQGCRSFEPIVIVVVIKFFSDFTVIGFCSHNFTAKVVNHFGNCMVAAQ